MRYPVWAHKPGTGLHISPPLRRPAGGLISNAASLQPTCVQACPAVLLDQTPLIETVLFMQENMPHTPTHGSGTETKFKLLWLEFRVI